MSVCSGRFWKSYTSCTREKIDELLARFEGFNNSDLSLLTYLLDFPKRDIVKIRRAVLRSASQPELRKLVLVVAWLDNLLG